MTRRWHRSLAALSLVCLHAAAEDTDWSGQMTLGVRGVDVDGDRFKYDQHQNLEDGLKLSELVLRAQSSGAGPEQIELALYDIGDPDRRAELTLRRRDRYRFAYRHHRSEYVYQDVLVLPADASVEQSSGGDFHRFDVRRSQDRASLEIDLSDRATLLAGFDRYHRSGDSVTVLDIEREEFEMDQPIDDTLSVTSLGLRYRWDRLSLAFTERYRKHYNDVSTVLPGFSPGFAPDEPTELNAFRLDQPVTHETWEHSLTLRARPGPRTRFDLDLLRADLDGDLRVRERSDGQDFAGLPFERDLTGSGSFDRRTDLVRARGSYALNDAVRLIAGARHHRADQSSQIALPGEDGSSSWDIRNRAFEFGAEARLARHLVATAGWIHERRKRTLLQPEQDDPDTESSRHRGFFAELSWRPVSALSLWLGAEDSQIDDPFTLATASDRRRYRVRARYRLDDRWSLSASHLYALNDNDDSDWRFRNRTTTVRVHYDRGTLDLSLGAVRMDQDREITRLVQTPGRSALFDIDYASEATFYDAAATWRPSPRVALGGRLNRYRNRGSFRVERDDGSAFVALEPATGYRLQLEYRRIDFEEGGIEAYDANLIELSLRRVW